MINAHNSASYSSHDQSRISEILARHSSIRTHNLAQPIANNCSRINENSVMGAHANNHDSALYDALKSSRIDEDLAHTRKPYGSSKWKVPAYHRPYPLHVDYLKTPDGWWIPDFYEFSGEDDKTTVEHINVYLSQFGLAGKEDYMRIRNFPLSLTGIGFAWFTSLPQCTVGSRSQLEEQFYKYFGKTNEKRLITIESSAKRGLLVGMKERFDSDISKGSATKAKQHNILSESITF
jgi:hypothetical protein